MNTIIIKIAKKDTDFVGINCQKNEMIITFPIGYDITEEQLDIKNKDKVKRLIPDFKIIISLLEKMEEEKLTEGNVQFSFTAAHYLIKDYFNKGLYEEYNKKEQNNFSGNINFFKTISSTLPILTSNNNFIYTNVISDNINYENNDITEIQKYCLSKSFRILGLYYDEYPISFSYKPFSKSEMLDKISKRIMITHNDCDLQRLKMMKLFILGVESGEEVSEIKIGINRFHLVWEMLLKKQIKKKYELLECYPQAYYMIDNQKKLSSNLIPDIVFEKDVKIHIIDAKYYQINKLPQSSDIFKQLTYVDFIQNATKKEVVTYFLLPNKIKEKTRYLGYATDEYHELKKRIEVYYLDTKSILLEEPIIFDIIK